MSSRPAVAGAALVALIAAAPVALGTWLGMPPVPVRRLIENVGKYVAEHPDDPRGHATLARIHSLAFALDTRVIGARERGQLPVVASDKLQQSFGHAWRIGSHERSLERGLDPFDLGPPSPDEQLEHLSQAVRSYRLALALDEAQAAVHLGLAHVLEVGAHLASHLRTGELLVAAAATHAPEQGRQLEQLVLALGDPAHADAAERELRASLATAAADLTASVLDGFRTDVDAARQVRVSGLLADYWREVAIAHDLRAFELSAPADGARPELPLAPPGEHPLSALVSYEAGSAYTRLVQARGARDDVERARLNDIGATLRRLASLPPPRMVTPIIFSLASSGTLRDLLARGATARFDLDGDGVVEAWPWVEPATAILVWDPEQRGKITSGMQLFGSVTWWMFFADGYHALDALDDDRDGELAGRELSGLALWLDHDGNGCSDPGEVTPIERTPIVSIATHATGKDGLSPWCARGVRLTGGRVLPSYDWVACTAPLPRP